MARAPVLFVVAFLMAGPSAVADLAAVDPLNVVDGALDAWALLEGPGSPASAFSTLATSALELARSAPSRDRESILRDSVALAGWDGALADKLLATPVVAAPPLPGHATEALAFARKAPELAARVIEGDRDSARAMLQLRADDVQAAPPAPPADLAVEIERFVDLFAPSASEDERDALERSAEALPTQAREALAHLLSTYRSVSDVRDATLGGLPELAPDVLARGAHSNAAAPDMTELTDASADLLVAALGAARVFSSVALANPIGPITLCGAITLDLAGVPSDHSCDARISIDVGGDDVYRNSAGGGRGSVALLLDLAGNDRYVPVYRPYYRPVNGAAYNGVGMLVDLEGNDEYAPERTSYLLANGASLQGVGMILDARGDDRYVASSANMTIANAASYQGLGVILDAAGNDSYDADVAYGLVNGASGFGSGLLYDGGGSDVYSLIARNSTYDSSANGASYGGAGILVDAGAGDDRYLANASAGVVANGGGWGGSLVGTAPQLTATLGLLYDAGGADVYSIQAAWTAMGNGVGVWSGIGMLVDEGETGPDAYRVRGDLWAIGNGGGGVRGVGLLEDRSALGSDDYRVEAPYFVAGNGGAYADGSGTLFDAGGSDSFVARAGLGAAVANGGGWGSGTIAPTAPGVGTLIHEGTGSDLYEIQAQWDGIGNGGGYFGANGALHDGGGSDRYSVHAGYGTANGGAYYGSGAALFDGGGADSYIVVCQFSCVGNGASWTAHAVLHDVDGDDLYTLEAEGTAVANGGTFFGVASLRDEDGDDEYRATIGGFAAAHGGGYVGAGLLWDDGGHNTFVATARWPLGVAGGADGFPFWGPVKYPGGLGVLFAGAGDDTFVGNGTTQGSGRNYGVGVLVDAGGHNTFVAGPGGYGQGAGVAVGVGILVDHGVASNYTLVGGAAGQGMGDQGVGLLLRTNELSTSSYTRDETQDTASLAGAGASLRLDLGVATEAQPRVLACGATGPIGSEARELGLAYLELTVCPPDRSTERDLNDPRTGAPMQDRSKPSVPCTDLAVGPVRCAEIVAALLGPRAVGWLESTHLSAKSSGGFAIEYGRYKGTGLGGTPAEHASARALVVLAMADDGCDIACGQWE